jgi:hypothetical protein
MRISASSEAKDSILKAFAMFEPLLGEHSLTHSVTDSSPVTLQLSPSHPE